MELLFGILLTLQPEHLAKDFFCYVYKIWFYIPLPCPETFSPSPHLTKSFLLFRVVLKTKIL